MPLQDAREADLASLPVIDAGNLISEDAAVRMISGTARNMGIEVID